MQGNIKLFNCDDCVFKCYKLSLWNRHVTTSKHQILTDPNNLGSIISKIYECYYCKKTYKHASTLSTHKKKCNKKEIIENIHVIDEKVNDNIVFEVNTQMNDENVRDTSNNEIKVLTSLVLDLVKSNHDLQKQMIELCKNNNTTINSHNNNNNKTFNLQFFLNEECKDAMNLNDFVESVQLQMADLEKIGELGYVEGVSKFIMGKLNETDVNKRPVHCSDAKRETLYVKDDNVWTKEGEENSKIRGAVKKIEKKNIKLLNVWKETHAGCMDSDSPYNDQYTHMIIGSLGGCEPDNVNKVIKKIAKATIIDK